MILKLVLAFLVLAPVQHHANADESESPISLESCQTSDAKSKLCLMALLTYRCAQYSLLVGPVNKLCQASVPAFVATLDVTQFETRAEDEKSYKLPVIFKTRLLKLIQDPLVQDYITKLYVQITEASRERTSFDLFQKTVEIAGNPQKATEWLAVLFQDTSWTRWHIRYLESIEAKSPNTPIKTSLAIRHLKHIVVFLDGDNLKSEDYRSWLKLYPESQLPGLNKVMNHSLYHFYPMAYIAQTLKQAGVSDQFSFFMPFLFNTDYDFREIDEKRWPFAHPLPFKITPSLNWAMQDIYAGYAGSRLGIGKLKGSQSYDQLTSRLAAAPAGTMRSLFWNGLVF